MTRQVLRLRMLLVALIVGAMGSARADDPAATPSPDVVDFTILQLNDVYEIESVNRGAVGGLARVAYVRQQLLEENPNTITVIAGDFLSPAALGTAKIEGEELAGRQMVAVLNALGLDYATFGNHEFDLKERAFFSRLKEARFRWFASNVTLNRGGKPYTEVPVPAWIVHEFRSPKGGRNVRVGLFGLTFNLNYKTQEVRAQEEAEKKAAQANGKTYTQKLKVPYAVFSPTIEAAEKMVAKLRDQEKADIVIAVTHLPLESDKLLDASSSCDLEVGKVPNIDLILGGHEHESVFRYQRGVAVPPIFKADSNVRTVYVHKVRFNRAAGKLDRIDSYLKAIAADTPEEPGTAAVVRAWCDQAFRAFRGEGLDPARRIGRIVEPLDGLEAHVRNGPTNLTRLIGRAMLRAASNPSDASRSPRLAVFNSGSVRIDDYLTPGYVIEFDVKRILPYDGRILSAMVRGDAIVNLLSKGTADGKRGTGGYLQITGARLVDEEGGGRHWETADGGPIVPSDKLYPIVFNDYLLKSVEEGFNAPVSAGTDSATRGVGYEQQDLGSMQRAVIAQFQVEFGLNPQADPIAPAEAGSAERPAAAFASPATDSATRLAAKPPADGLPPSPLAGTPKGANRNTITIDGRTQTEPDSPTSENAGNINTITISLAPLVAALEDYSDQARGQNGVRLPRDPAPRARNWWNQPDLLSLIEELLGSLVTGFVGMFLAVWLALKTVLRRQFVEGLQWLAEEIRRLVASSSNREAAQTKAQSQATDPPGPR